MFKKVTKIISKITYVVTFVVLVFIFAPNANDEVLLLINPHGEVYPDGIIVSNAWRHSKSVEYSYNVDNQNYRSSQRAYNIYLWINSFFNEDEQYAVIYSIDDPGNSKLLGDLYLDLLFDLGFLILIVGAVVIVAISYIKKKNIPPPPSPDAISKIA